MKPDSLFHGIVINADQRASRRNPDRVPAALAELNGQSMVLPFERTTGDEIQGLTDCPDTAVAVVLRLTRSGLWRIGLGIGTVETPLAASTRAARGQAYLEARQAIERAGRVPCGVAVCGPGAEPAEAALWLLTTLAAQRSGAGWELADLLAGGLNQAEAAARLGISPSAVSQRASRAHLTEIAAGARLASGLLASALSLSGASARVMG